MTDTPPSAADLPSSQDDLLNPRAILRVHDVRPNKRLGQHFLTSRKHLARIVEAADLRPADTVLEIGPGLGVLTDALACRVARVVAVEVDASMRVILASTIRNHTNVEIVGANALDVDPGTLVGTRHGSPGRLVGYKVVANLPYQITSAVLRHVLEAETRPELAVVMVQAEVADRILAKPGDMSILAVAVQFYAMPSLVTRVPSGAFHPPPKVDSAVLRLDVYDEPPVDVTNVDAFFRTVRAGFSQKRKQLKNSVAAGLALEKSVASAALEEAGIDPTRRAETLALEEWAALTHAVARQ